jgi:DNA-binding response OmpR family regulator
MRSIEERGHVARTLRDRAPRRHILVVEDDPAFADLVRSELMTGGYLVTLASSVGEARHQMDVGITPDLILSDVRLPGEPGTDFLAEDAEATRLPVLMMSAFPSDELRELIEGRGAAILDKPFSFGRLHASVMLVLMRRAREAIDGTRDRDASERRDH